MPRSNSISPLIIAELWGQWPQLINTDSKSVCARQCNAILGIDDMLYMPHMSALILSNLLFHSCCRTGRFTVQVIHSTIVSTVNGQFTTLIVSSPASSQEDTGGDCGKMVVMALSRKKGGASLWPRRLSGGVALLTYSSGDLRIDFPLNHVSTMSEMNGWDDITKKKTTTNKWVISHVTLYFYLLMWNSSFTYLNQHGISTLVFPVLGHSPRPTPPPTLSGLYIFHAVKSIMK